MRVQELENEIIGKDFTYKKVKSTSQGSIFSAHNSDDGRLYGYEVFKRKLTPICIDFEKRVFSETDFKVRYPKTNDFGVWAWAPKTIERAEEILNML